MLLFTFFHSLQISTSVPPALTTGAGVSGIKLIHLHCREADGAVRALVSETPSFGRWTVSPFSPWFTYLHQMRSLLSALVRWVFLEQLL